MVFHKYFITFAFCLCLLGCASDKSYFTKIAPLTKKEIFQIRKDYYIENLKKDDEEIDFDAAVEALNSVTYADKIIEQKNNPFHKRKNWSEHQKQLITSKRIEEGVQFYRQHQKVLDLVYQEYGVDPFIVVALLGIETNYGEVQGTYRAIDALSNLAFSDISDADLFLKELTNYFVLTNRYKIDPQSVYSSYAGALGYPQFMPSSYLKYAVSVRKHHSPDLFHEVDDVLMSIGNYLNKYGWEKNKWIIKSVKWEKSKINDSIVTNGMEQYPVIFLKKNGVIFPKSIEKERFVNFMKLYFDVPGTYKYFVGSNNFLTIMKYNHNALYAMTVYTLAERIKTHFLQTKVQNNGGN